MKEMLSRQTLFNTVAMIHMESRALILVVEGEDDHFILRPHATQELLIVCGYGRPSVLGAAHLAEVARLERVAFLVDADYDRFGPKRSYPSAVIVSENHDLVIDLIMASTTVIDRVIEAHARSACRHGNATLDPADMRLQALDLASRVALLRVVNERDRLNLNLARYPFGRLTSTSPSYEEIARLAVERSRDNCDPVAVAQEMQLIEQWAAPAAALPGDHDFFGALARVLSDNCAANITARSLEAGYLGAISCATLAGTPWFQRVGGWSSSRDAHAFSCPCAA